LQLISLLILLFFSAFFSASETALTALGKFRLKALLEKEGNGTKAVDLWAKDPNRFLATILFGNNVVNIGASVLASFIAMRIFGNELTAKIAWGVTGIMTFIILTFGELVPKQFARDNAERIAPKIMGFLKGLSFVLAPFIRVLLFVSRGTLRIFGKKVVEPGPFMTEEEIKSLIGLGEEEGVLEEDEKEMIESIFEFGDTKVQEVMVPRTEMSCVEINTELEGILSLLREVGYSRIPVYEERVDNIVGFLYAKDLLKLLGGREEKELVVRDFIREPYFVPETKQVNELLREFQRNKIHMAVVVDEYGGVAGLITLEDLIEEIVGEIEDEYDTGEESIKHLENGEAFVDAGIDIGELNEELGIMLPEQEGIETLGGFITNFLGHVPSVGEVVECEGFTICVVEATKRRVGKVKLCGLGGGDNENRVD